LVQLFQELRAAEPLFVPYRQ